MPEVIFAVFAFCRPSITASVLSNGLDLSGSRSRGGREKDESFPSFEKLMLDVERV